MKTQTESFVSEVILSPTYNIMTSGDVEAPSGYFGYMTFDSNEFTVDSMDTPTEFLGRTVVAMEDSYGNIEYSVIPSEDFLDLAETWFEAQEEHYANWSEDN